jgi:hypothetical protein
VLALVVVGGGIVAWRMSRSEDDGPVPLGVSRVKGLIREMDGGYYLDVQFRLLVEPKSGGPGHEEVGLDVKTACRVGGHVFTETSPYFASNHMRMPGLPKGSDSIAPFVTNKLPGHPDRCQADFRLKRGIDDAGPLGSFCFEGSSVKPGPCDPPLAAPPPPGRPPLMISDVACKMGTDIRERPSIVVDWIVTSSTAQDGKHDVGVLPTCHDDSGEHVGNGFCSGSDHLMPGESVTCGTIPYTFSYLPGTPDWCDLRFVSRLGFDEPVYEDLATYCWRPGQTPTPGACPR